MDAFLQNITVKANSDCELAGNEEEDFEDFEFLETLDGLLINLPKFFGISDQLMDQMLEFYFYDVTKIGKYFSTDKGRNNILKTFGIPSDFCLDKLYLLVPSDVDSDYVCTRCNNTVKGNDFFSLVCGHFFCRQCWISSIQEGSLCCLEGNCNCKMPFIDAQNLYPEIDAEKFKSMIRLLTQLDYEKKLLTRGKDLNCCPNCGKQIEFQYVNFGCIFCRQCKKFYCLKCRQEAHLPLSCQENHEFKSIVSKYSSMPKELNEYKQYHNCKIRLDQEKKEIQQIIHFTLKENNVKIDEALNRNLSSIRSIYEMIQNNLSNNNDFDNYEILNDQDFLNNNDELNVFKEKYPSQFVYLLDNYKNIIKKEEEVKVHFKDISRLIEELELVFSLPSYFYDLSIILDYKPLNEDFVYEEQQFEVDFEVGSDIDEDPSNLNDLDVLNTNSDDNSQPIFNDNVNGDDELKSSLDVPSLNSNEEISSYGIESYLANNNDNSKSNICNNYDESYQNNDNNGNNNGDNNDNNNDNNDDNNGDNNDNNNDNNNNNEQMQTDEELLRQKEKMLEEYQRELQSQYVPENPLQDALNSYINAFKENPNGINMPMQQCDIENDESAVEYSINKYLILIFRNHKNAFLHFNRKNKSLKHLQLLCANVERFLFENDEKMKYDLQYYLILIRYFSTHLD